MKKLFLIISVVFLVLFGMSAISAGAERYTELPITMYQSYNGSESMFTMTDFKISVYTNDSPKYTNKAYIYISGSFNMGSSMNLSFYCYDASGNHIKAITKKINSSDFNEFEGDDTAFLEFNVPDVTASIEVGTAYPAAWTNTYYYCKYINVYSEDGRVLGIHDLLLPVYKNCGWHSTVWMYSLDGDTIEIPYCDINAYKKVGWYLWPDYCYHNFKNNYNRLTQQGNYADAFNSVQATISQLKGTYYESSLYSYKTKLMDAWRKKNNGPLAYSSSYVNKSKATITFRNVSYKTIKAFKFQFDCYDVFGYKLGYGTKYYSVTNDYISSSNTQTYTCSNLPSQTDNIKNLKITQVVYSDGTSWYR